MTNDADIKVVIDRVHRTLGHEQAERVKVVIRAAKSVTNGPKEVASVLATALAIHAVGQTDPAKCVAAVHDFMRTMVNGLVGQESS